MSKFNKTQLTPEGFELMKKANRGEAKFTITKAQVYQTTYYALQDKDGKEYSNIEDLANSDTQGMPKPNVNITSMTPTKDEKAIMGIRVTIDNKSMVPNKEYNEISSYFLQSIILFAKEENSNKEIPYAYANANGSEMITIPAYTDHVLYKLNVMFYLIVGKTENVTVNVVNDGLVTQEDLKNAIKVKTVNGQSPDKNGNINVLNSVVVEAGGASPNTSRTIKTSLDNDTLLVNKPSLVNALSSTFADNSDGPNTTVATKADLENAGKVKTVNYVSPDSNGNINTITSASLDDEFEIQSGGAQKSTNSRLVKAETDNSGNLHINKNDLAKALSGNKFYDAPETTLATKADLKSAGKVKTVNGQEPDEDGNVTINLDEKADKSTTYTKNEVNEKLKDAGKVKTVNGNKPDSNGNIQIITNALVGQSITNEADKPAIGGNENEKKEIKIALTNDGTLLISRPELVKALNLPDDSFVSEDTVTATKKDLIHSVDLSYASGTGINANTTISRNVEAGVAILDGENTIKALSDEEQMNDRVSPLVQRKNIFEPITITNDQDFTFYGLNDLKTLSSGLFTMYSEYQEKFLKMLKFDQVANKILIAGNTLHSNTIEISDEMIILILNHGGSFRIQIQDSARECGIVNCIVSKLDQSIHWYQIPANKLM